MNDLINDIEKLRKELYVLLDYKNLTDIKVVICSQELDKLLVQYEERMNLIIKTV